jgi:hypothetical protein
MHRQWRRETSSDAECWRDTATDLEVVPKFSLRSLKEPKLSADAKSWAQQFSRLSDENPTIQAMGKYFTCSYMLDMEERKAIIRMHDGKVDEIDTEPAPLDPYDFAIRASPETWRKFGMKMPPPMCHGIWAATFREDMKLEGDLLVLMQNLRNITLQVELLRQTGVPV